MSKPIDIAEDLAPEFWTGSIAVGVAIVQLVTVPVAVMKGIQLKADAANTGIIYIGKSKVTPASADATDGIPLAAGEGIFVPIADITKLYAIADAAAQEIYWMAI